MKKPLISFFTIFLANTLLSGNICLSDLDWKFRQAGTEEWMPANVPGCVHLDLFNNGKIGAPNYGLNEADQKWIENEDWEYTVNFDMSEKVLAHDIVEINFEGLDTYADVYLNDSPVLQANNFFRSWKINVKEYLKSGKNNLRIYFHSPVTYVMSQYKSLPFKYASSNDQSEVQVSMFTRKPAYHYGWDWGPRFVTSGIWKEITLSAWNKCKIQDVWIRQDELADNIAKLTALLEIISLVDRTVEISVVADGSQLIKQIALRKGENTIDFPFEINKPECWWPNGMGSQKLYDVEVLLRNDGIEELVTKRIGLRTFEVITNSDSIGRSFYFQINGVPFFAKGANYIPQDLFIPAVPDQRYHFMLQSCVDANMNMIRVWGGGIYEQDIFYNLCDELGIVVWQDFMFACSMYPGDRDFIENVKQEAVQNIVRLRNHPSLALWCGNNENEVALRNWKDFVEVVKQYPFTLKEYTRLFEELLPGLVAEYDPDKFYMPTSPTSFEKGIDPMSHLHGDLHYWKVWSGGEDYIEYKNSVGRFMSEYGFQSFPKVSTIANNCTPEDLDKYSEIMIFRTRWGGYNNFKTGWRKNIDRLDHYIQQNFEPDESFDDFVYKSQVMQADAIRFAILQHRKKMPYCMGSLYWQLNDVWPGASWSGIDYYGNWKPLHYTLKHAFKNVAVFIEPTEKDLQIFVVSDELKNILTNATVYVYTLEGKLINKTQKSITIKGQAVSEIINTPYSEILIDKNPKEVFIKAVVGVEDNIIAEEIRLLDRVKNIKLQTAHVSSQIVEKSGDYFIQLKSDKPAFYVWVEPDIDKHVLTKDNFVTVLPEQPKLLPLNNSNNDYSLLNFTVNWINR